MSKTNLHSFLKNIADSIRLKSGSNELINPQDFASKIKDLPAGTAETPRSYYKINKNKLSESGLEFSEAALMLFDILVLIDSYSWILYFSPRDQYFEVSGCLLSCFFDQAIEQFIGYFCTYNDKNYTYIASKDQGIVYRGKINERGLKNRFIETFVTIEGMSYEEAEEYVNMLCIEEITKEEYESQLTIK